MDTEHWFAPMKSNYSAGNYNYQAVYLSTSETAAFNVQIYSGNSLIGSVSLKKGSPQTFVVPRQYIITEEDSECSVVLPQKGLHLVGTKKYFATLRFSVPNHAEIVTSKGKAALGNEFYLGMPSLNSTARSNYEASILATENGTSVTLSGYSNALIFTNDASATATKNIILNKGESYIFEVDEGTNFGLQGLIGAKINSDKPITVSNGSFSGRISTDGVDIFMDQSVPVEKTGKEFIVMGGNGNFPDSAIESTLIVATQDNTDIFLNNSATPDFTIAKAGQFVFVNSTSYTPLDKANNIYALYIKTSKNAYVYEILAGSASQEKPSGGMNLIPALSCFLPSKIDEMSEVNHLPLTASNIGFQEYHNVKLNILAQKGSSLTVNGSTTDLLGPFTVPGSSGWEVYSKLAVSGNQTIQTSNDRAITAGIAGGSGPAGFGGYFAGFSSIPSISKSGSCANGQILEVDDFYNKYEWYFSTDNISWVKLPDTGYAINPGTNFGYYKVTVTKYSCSPPQTTKEFKYIKCPMYTKRNYRIGACNSIPVITPVLTKNPALLIDVSKTAIISQPSGGKAYVDAAGNIHFDANNTREEQVAFTYYLEQAGVDFPEYEEVTVTVNIVQIKTQDVEITECLDRNGNGIYNLKNAFEQLNVNPEFISYEYYTDAAFTSRIPDSDIQSYYSKPNLTIYVKITNVFGCDNRLKPAKISLKTYELPEIKYIDVKGQTSAVIYIEKGNLPYYILVKKGKLPLDYIPNDSEYQEYSSGTVEVPISEGKGYYTVFIKSVNNCLPVMKYFSVIGITNVVTPNGDGYNDKIDVSALNEKVSPVFEIYDRYGKKVFEGNTENNFIWNGRYNGFAIPTGTYWYLLKWQDYPDSDVDLLQGWILVKNRE
ncbi:T9SS type B sorting domain-containing protein [uncultured Chryseobacterium sp.]|uniref:T9SS type B sorting domain-containing protein n=1 Tax=uncultured Chryseobacterium sp. TaxID=259322 RepID=UPI00261F2E0C|nr:T9SS type B sorting domain-containing protein [uncultured Chryseobacterium sp.]